MNDAVSRSAWLLLLFACSDSHDVRVDGGSAPEELEGEAIIDARGCRPDAEFLVGGGRAATGCSGECGFDLALASTVDIGSGACVGYAATLRVSNERGEALAMVRADLSDIAWDRAAVIASRLRANVLERRYGCPDCARTAAWVLTRSAGGEAQPHAFPSGQPPTELATAHRFIDGLIEQLRTCEGPDLLSCSRSPIP